MGRGIVCKLGSVRGMLGRCAVMELAWEGNVLDKLARWIGDVWLSFFGVCNMD